MNVTNKPISFDMDQARDLFQRYWMPHPKEMRALYMRIWLKMQGQSKSPGVDKLMSDRAFLEWFLRDQMQVDVIVRPTALAN